MSEEMKCEKKSAAGLRTLAVLLWGLAIGCECGAMLAFVEKLNASDGLGKGLEGSLFLLADLILLIVGSQLWKNANRRAPALKKDGERRWWLFNNLGAIAAAACFLPFLLLTLSGKKTDGRAKKLSALAALVMLLADLMLLLL